MKSHPYIEQVRNETLTLTLQCPTQLSRSTQRSQVRAIGGHQNLDSIRPAFNSYSKFTEPVEHACIFEIFTEV